MNGYDKCLPQIDAQSRPYWDGLKKGEIRLPRCCRCHAFSTHFDHWCSQCGHPQFEWLRVEGEGTVWSFCIFHRQYFAGFVPPYNVALVELRGGLRLLTNIIDVDDASLAIGMRVEPVFEPVTPDVTLLKFRPAS